MSIADSAAYSREKNTVFRQRAEASRDYVPSGREKAFVSLAQIRM
jgi:hypothetical protein